MFLQLSECIYFLILFFSGVCMFAMDKKLLDNIGSIPKEISEAFIKQKKLYLKKKIIKAAE